jgi:flagellar motor protein MotB
MLKLCMKVALLCASDAGRKSARKRMSEGCKRLTAKGLRVTKPAAGNSAEEARAKNRRFELAKM